MNTKFLRPFKANQTANAAMSTKSFPEPLAAGKHNRNGLLVVGRVLSAKLSGDKNPPSCSRVSACHLYGSSSGRRTASMCRGLGNSIAAPSGSALYPSSRFSSIRRRDGFANSFGAFGPFAGRFLNNSRSSSSLAIVKGSEDTLMRRCY